MFVVTKGEAKIILDNDEIILKKDESYLIDGDIPHSVWNNIDNETVMIGINLKKNE